GSESISRLDYALLFADVLGCDPGLVKPVPTPASVVDTYRHIGIPLQTRMSSEKTTRALGRSPMNVREGIEAFLKELDELNA
ncbi:MAG TPA: hypothetical protein VJZ27_07060, partial [Aggregatilineales bacterium]|nr:hypothetical protein [Aggregatilineales bacterium]